MKNTILRKLSSLVASALLVLSVQAATWWVDDDNYGNGGTGTESNPFGTIQDALDNPSFTAGDTVNVKAGVYNRGSTINSTYGGTGVGNRVVITQKVHIKAVDGRENTFIVGADAATSPNADGQGSDAVRCILYCDQSKYSSGGAIVEGFTICGGRTANADNTYGYGAGVFDAGGAGGSRYQIWIVDCTISNCVAGAGGATRFGSLYRCLVTDCKASRRVSGIHGAHAHSCIISHISESGSSPQGLALQVTAVNCTFFGNKIYLAPESGNKLSSYNCIIAGDGNYEFPYSKTTSTATDGFYQLFAPAVGDYRPLPGSRAATLGTAANLAQINVIDDVKPLINGVRTLVDYAGNPYPSSGTVASGAIQEIAPAPAGGALQFDIDNCTVNGNIAHSGAYVYPETYPTQYVVEATEKTVYCYWRNVGSGTEMVVPRMDDTALLMPPPSVGEVSTNTAQYASAELYIDPVSGNDANSGSAEAPFRTLQKGFDAVRYSSDYRVIHAAAGDYREGGAPMYPDYNNPDYSYDGLALLTNRLCIGTGRKVRFKGAGAGRSFIYGAPDMTTATGLGPAAIRPLCIYSADSIVQGFTMADGYSGNTGVTSAPYRSDDFIVYGRTDSTPAHVADCVVTNCHAARAVTTFVNWQRSLFIDCSSGSADSAGSWINYSGMLESCAFAGITYRAGSSGLCRNNYSCSFSGNAQADVPFGNDYYVMACAIDGCKSLRSGSHHRGSVADNVTTAFNYDGVSDDVVAFVDAAHGDFRVKSYSGAANCVPAPSADMTFWETYWRHACGDLNGRPLIVFPDGSILAGAVQEMVDASGKVYVRTSRGGLGDGTSAYANGEYDVGGGTLSVSPADGTRPCVGFTVDGVTNLFEGSSWPIAVSAAASGSIVRAIYGTDWYVDDENGNDGNNGFLPSLAKKTLAAALGATGIASGDTVHAAAGTYADGVMSNGASTQMGSRAIVPQGVTLKGAGAGRTVIVGAEATVGVGEYGCGSNAVRCVALERYATVQGFTLTGGHTCCNHIGESAGKTDVNNQGGGVVAVGTERTTAYADRNVIDCVISNNVAGRAGGAGYVTLRRCRVVGNRGTDPTGQASGTFYCSHYGCVVENQLAQYGAMYPYAVCESTLKEDGSYWTFYSNSDSQTCEIRNSLFLGRSQIKQPDSVATNSIFTYAPTITSGHDVVGPNSRVISNPASLQFDANLCPVIGANEAIGAGDLSLLGDADKEADCDGGQRVYNDGKLDIGALEADWRPRYAADISGKKKFSVTAASPEVVEAFGIVQLPEGSTLDAKWSFAAGTKRYYEVSVRVAAGSTVVVELNGETLATCATEGVHQLKFANGLADNVLSFACTAGSADILSAEWFKGTTISIR